MRWACLAIFFLALGLGEFCTRDAWNLPSEGTGVVGFPAGQSSRRDQCTGTGSFLLVLHACVDFLTFFFLVMVVDVPVIINDKFQQSVPLLFIFRLLVLQLPRRDRYPQCIRSCSLCSS